MMHQVTRSLLVLAIMFGSIAQGQDEPSNPLGPMGDSLTGVTRLEETVAPELAQRIGELADVEPRILESATLYSATFALQEGESNPARVLVMPTESVDDAGRLGIGVDAATGEVLTVALWGRAMFDDDPEGDWLAFVSQFKPTGTLGFVIDPEEAPTPEEFEQIDQSISDGSDAVGGHGIPIITLYRHRYMMLKNSAYFTKGGALRRQGRMYTADELRDWSGGLLWLSGQADSFEPVIGEAAARRYKELADPIREIFGAAIEAAEHEDHQGVADAIRPLYPTVCQRCHEVSDHPLGERSIYWDFHAELRSMGVRTNLGILGADTWGPRGEARDTARVLARQIRAGLMVLGAD